jgi:hypothetical protein
VRHQTTRPHLKSCAAKAGIVLFRWRRLRSVLPTASPRPLAVGGHEANRLASFL